jgi:hypothetical protein
MSSVLGSNCLCEQLFGLNQNIKLRTRTRLTDEHLEDWMRAQQQKLKRDFEELD